MFGRFARKTTKMGSQLGKSYYDDAFTRGHDWKEHYTKSSYYFIWTVIVDRLRTIRPSAVLEIGCGPGQLASAIHEAGLASKYSGIDFSAAALNLARKACPSHFTFVEADAVNSNLYDSAEYDTVLSTEFLEHIEDDLKVLGKLRRGTQVLATVPNFTYVSHVRYFTEAAEVVQRYGNLFRNFTVTTIPGVQTETAFFLMQGEKI